MGRHNRPVEVVLSTLQGRPQYAAVSTSVRCRVLLPATSILSESRVHVQAVVPARSCLLR